jgi:osmotically-inducible protein OsmY
MSQRQRTVLFGLGGLTLGTAIGAGLMFLLDPANGYRRRGALRRLLSAAREEHPDPVAREAAGTSGFGERSRSLAAAVRARLHRHRADGRTLEARVRARLGRVATNPGAIAVIAEGSRVTLRGAVPPDELDDVLDEVAAVDGVGEIYNLLQVQLAVPPVPGHN